MTLSIRELINGHENPVCILKETKVREALALMMENDYSQLPILDEQGKLFGVITEQSIVNTYSVVGDKVALLDMMVDHCYCSTKQSTISPDESIFDVLGRLKNAYAVIVVENDVPVGIVTAYDTTYFFSNYSDGLMHVQDVEEFLRNYIENTFNNEKKIEAALYRAFGPDKKNPNKAAREYDELTFWETVQLIVTDGNWDKFEPFFSDKSMLLGLMEPVRDVRNKLAHFRGELSNKQRKHLIQAIDWLSARPKVPLNINVADTVITTTISGLDVYTSGALGKYAGIEDWLLNYHMREKIVHIPLHIIEELIKEPLPKSAYKHRSWWSNDYGNPQAMSWINAGWIVQNVDLTQQLVTYQKTIQAYYIAFFSDLLVRIKKEREGITRIDKVSSRQNWLSIINRGGCTFNWVLPKVSFLRVEVYIDVGVKQSNKLIFGLLLKQKVVIESEIGEKLIWDELVESKASRISAVIPFRVTKSPEEHEPVKQWGVNMMIKFIDAFLPRMTSL